MTVSISRRAPGESVRAAAAGQVVYAGSELAGYGQLVLVRHTGGFVTAYAHNSRLLVSEGDQVSQGQVIAEAGSTGSVDRPQVHFEIRNGVNPVDPDELPAVTAGQAGYSQALLQHSPAPI